jgi:hypothetical protein
MSKKILFVDDEQAILDSSRRPLHPGLRRHTMQTSAMKANNRSRRNFLQGAAFTVGAMGAASKAIGQIKIASVALVADPNDPLVSSSPVARALKELETALRQESSTVQRVRSVEDTANYHLYVTAAANDSPVIMRCRSQLGARFHPGLNSDLTNQPNFVVRSV